MTKANQDMGFSHIDFQNSCDVDYDFSYWGTIPIFKKIIKQYKNATTYDLYSEYKSTKTLEELYEDLDYYTKSMVYHKIFEILDLENYLCGKEGNYQRFHLSSINCIEDYYKCQIALMKVKKNLHFE